MEAELRRLLLFVAVVEEWRVTALTGGVASCVVFLLGGDVDFGLRGGGVQRVWVDFVRDLILLSLIGVFHYHHLWPVCY